MNKKLMLFLNACMLQFANVGGGYNSSAQILETDLARLGIKFPKKLWFQYKLPGGQEHSLGMGLPSIGSRSISL